MLAIDVNMGKAPLTIWQSLIMEGGIHNISANLAMSDQIWQSSGGSRGASYQPSLSRHDQSLPSCQKCFGVFRFVERTLDTLVQIHAVYYELKYAVFITTTVPAGINTAYSVHSW